jgi:subfamily B ATP-binding cassette protein MsbA
VKSILKIRLRNRHRRILALIRQNSGRLFMAALCSLMVSGATTAMGYLIKPVIDDIFVNRDTAGLVLLPLVVIVVFTINGLGRYGQEYFMNYVGEDIIRRLRNQLYDRIQDLSLAFFQKERTGTLMSRITNDVNILKSMVSTAVTSSLRDAATIVGLTAVIFYQNWRMAIIAFFILPMAFWPIFILGRKVRKVSTGCQEAMADMSAFLHETLAGNKIVKAFGMEGHEKRRFFNQTARLFKLEIKGVKIRALSSPIMEFFGGLGIAFVIWYGGSEVIAGKTTPGTFMSFLACVLLLYDPVKKLSKLNNAIQQGLASADRIFDIIETRSEIVDPQKPSNFGKSPHEVRFEQVRFQYGDQEILKGIDLTVEKGRVLALVGMSGGGKSTIANLIPRFFDVNEGHIRIDDTDIRDFTVADLRSRIAIVSQEPILFNETVRDNIIYGRPEAAEEEVVAAAEAAFAHDFIMRFSNGYDTLIGELGGRLSGGEKQRLCIARALIKDAPILILDEATSSLDSEAESVVQKALDNLMRGRTTLVIAHRLSTIAGADHIAVIVKGRIVEEGRHHELLDRQGEYFKLHRMQSAGRRSSDNKNPAETDV